MKKKILSLLVLLTAAVTGAWAQETVTWTWDDLKTIKVADGQTYDEFSMGNDGYERKSITLKGITLCCYYVGTKEYNHVYGYTGSLAQYYQWNNGSKFYMVCSDYFDDDGKKSGNFTFSCEDEYVITKMKMVCPNCTTYVAIPDGVCEVEGSTDFGGGGCTITWTGAKQEILFDCNVDVSSIEFTIEPDAPATDFKFNVAKCEHGSGKVTFTVQDKDDAENITENAKGANEGDKVIMTITPDEGWVVDVDNVKAKAATNWEAAGARRMAPEENLSLDMLGDVKLTFVGTDTETGVATYTFTMPASSVMASAAYLKLSTLYFDPADRTNLMEVKVDGIVRNVEDNKTVKIDKVERVLEGAPVKLTANTGYKFRKVEVKKGASGSPLATPLTIEALTAGTIQVNIGGTLQTGMKYSVNGGTKTLITKSTDITVAKDDKVQFYGNGTDTQAYGDNPEVSIQGSGDGFQTKVYGNIMSLLDETGFATMTELPDAPYIFYKLFKENTTLIDASELLLPATKLVSSCYFGMFSGCTNLTTAPKLPATTLTTQCYYIMFKGCTSLTSAYVKAAYINESLMCTSMFDGCTATGAVLHTTSDNKASWENVMGSGKTWETWSVADDWQE